jgi:SSS family solute:Na+ symporter
VTMGGQISIMITECAQGMVSAVFMLIVAGFIWYSIQWPDVVKALAQAPKDQSMLNPFHTSGVKDFNIWYYLIGIFGAYYSYMSWQGGQGFFSSARTPHEQRMGNIIGGWRALPQGLLTTLLPLATLVIMRLPDHAAMAHSINATIATIPNESVRGQMLVPIAMAHFLPYGIKGLLAVIMLFFSFTCHDTYMHSWGSIFVQDVLAPIRNRAMTPEQHIKWLRWSIMGVAVFAFIFSMLYQPNEKIMFFFAITGTIWLGGSGAVIIGGLYSRWGTTAAAYAALILGAALGIGGLIYPRIYAAQYHREFPINGQWLFLIGMLGSIVVYGVVSLLTGGLKSTVNLDKILHRGIYKVETDQVHYENSKSIWLKMVGITDEFSKVDKFLALYVICYSGLSFIFFIVFSIINLSMPVADSAWAKYWHFGLLYTAIPAIPCTIWFTVGGIIDIKALFKALSGATRDHTDDGRVKSEPDVPVGLGMAPGDGHIPDLIVTGDEITRRSEDEK